MDHATRHQVRKKADAVGSRLPSGIPVVLSALLLAIVLYNAFALFSSNSLADTKIAEARELARPARLEVTGIVYPGCSNCFSTDEVLQKVNGYNVNVSFSGDLEYGSPEAAILMSRYGIDRLPTLVFTGELDKESGFSSYISQIGEKKGDAFIITRQKPAYFSVSENRTVGKVSAIVLQDSKCVSCTSLFPLMSSLKSTGINMASQRVVEYTSEEGRELIEKYRIEKVPALILDREASYYDGFDQGWQSLGTREIDAYVLRSINAPFVDTSMNKVNGLVDVIMIGDKSCPGCYDPSAHLAILSRFGVVIGTNRTLDASDAKDLISRYNITKLPTVILSDDASYYPSLSSVWKQVGSVESDGSFVFRNMEAMGKTVYRNLETGAIING